jgi:hypothetical protein
MNEIREAREDIMLQDTLSCSCDGYCCDHLLAIIEEQKEEFDSQKAKETCFQLYKSAATYFGYANRTQLPDCVVNRIQDLAKEEDGV